MPLFIKETYLDSYADDTTVHTASKVPDTIKTKLQISSNDFKIYCKQNKMYVHVLLGKTSLMILGSRQNIAEIESFEIFIDNEIIKQVDNQKLLGIIIDQTLSWDKQIDMVALNISRRITLLKLLSKYVGKDCLCQYYSSYILPIFDYGCLIWGGNTTAQSKRLVKLQKRAARIILRVDIMTPSESMFSQLKWLSFPKRIQYHVSIMMYKSLNNLAPDYMSDLFNKVSESHSRNLRSVSNDLLSIPLSKTRYYDRSFAIQGAKQWNSLPIDIRHAPSLTSFKHKVKMHLLST